ncbi:hypothetical protein [Streptomyces sp. NPDC058612]|uniref:hypothetical protein n=1 Tax=Streptomyces sp. NPDC058612 TaxID=3346555 RepID=UPI00365683FD
MRTHQAITLIVVTVGCGGFATAPAWAGGVGDFRSPAFGTSCANHDTGAHNAGDTTTGTGTLTGILAGLPLDSALNHCGGADLPLNANSYQAVQTVNNGNVQYLEDAPLAG